MVALTVSLILCPLAVVIVWYYVFASFIAAFIVYLVVTGGWERVVEMWQRTKYKNKLWAVMVSWAHYGIAVDGIVGAVTVYVLRFN